MLRQRWAVSLAVIFVVCLVVANASQRPDFSGAWKLDPKASGTAEAAPRNLTIKQSADTMVVDFHIEGAGPAAIFTFQLDGSETTAKNIKGEPLRFVARWQGEKLVVTIHEPARTDGRPSESVQTYELQGDKLIVETTRMGKTYRETFAK